MKRKAKDKEKRIRGGIATPRVPVAVHFVRKPN